jgi:pimeloyl-ACP methyl ester carboxylesterase
MKRITYLRTLRRRLLARHGERVRPVVLDEGAVYMLARLRVLGGERLRGPGFERWWHEEVRRWARCLDLVVRLDAPDPTLRERIRTRSQPHGVKHLSDGYVDSFAATYRIAYDEVIRALRDVGGPRILTIQTDEAPVDRIARRIVAEIQDTRGGP